MSERKDLYSRNLWLSFLWSFYKIECKWGFLNFYFKINGDPSSDRYSENLEPKEYFTFLNWYVRFKGRFWLYERKVKSLLFSSTLSVQFRLRSLNPLMSISLVFGTVQPLSNSYLLSWRSVNPLLNPRSLRLSIRLYSD